MRTGGCIGNNVWYLLIFKASMSWFTPLFSSLARPRSVSPRHCFFSTILFLFFVVIIRYRASFPNSFHRRSLFLVSSYLPFFLTQFASALLFIRSSSPRPSWSPGHCPVSAFPSFYMSWLSFPSLQSVPTSLLSGVPSFRSHSIHSARLFARPPEHFPSLFLFSRFQLFVIMFSLSSVPIIDLSSLVMCSPFVLTLSFLVQFTLFH